MEYKNWSKWFIFLSLFFVSLVAFVNYAVDPYGIYNSELTFYNKYRQDNRIRFVKAVTIAQRKPASIILGTSRGDYGYNPDHNFFIKPSYNSSINLISMSEANIFLKESIKGGNLKQVLLAADYIMFNSIKEKRDGNLNKYFNDNKYRYLISLNQLNDTIYTVLELDKESINMPNGAKMPGVGMEEIINKGDYLNNFLNVERGFYDGIKSDYRYQDTKNSSIEDFKNFLEISYNNGIKVDIVFGPSHIRQWEALDYFIGYDKWLKWKKDIVLAVNEVAKKMHKKPFRVVDFAIYNKYTASKIPTKPHVKMKYYRESSHYTMKLGDKVLDWLNGIKIPNIGVELNLSNIDSHLKQLKRDREKYIDSKAYKKEVFESYSNL